MTLPSGPASRSSAARPASKAGPDRLLADARDHRREGATHEARGKVRPTAIGVDWARPDLDLRIAARPALQRHLARNGGPRRRVLRMQQDRSVIALDHRQAPARPHHAAQLGQDRRGIGKVLQHEADEGMIEARPREGQGPEIGLPQRRHGQAGGPDSRLRLRERGRGDVTQVSTASGFCRRSGIVWAPTPLPASSTVPPAG